MVCRLPGVLDEGGWWAFSSDNAVALYVGSDFSDSNHTYRIDSDRASTLMGEGHRLQW